MSNKEEPGELDQVVARREKYRKLGESGVPLFPYTSARTHEVREVVESFAALSAADLEARAATVVVPGRILSIRKMGRATFFHISDGQAKLQAYIREDRVGAEAYDRFGLFDLGDVVSVSGSLFKTRTGELTVLCDAVTFLAKCFRPLPEKWHGLQDIELRLYPAVLRRPRLPRGRDADDARHPRRGPGPAVQDAP
jgi:lysyl-tRNA synthetase class 2